MATQLRIFMKHTLTILGILCAFIVSMVAQASALDIAESSVTLTVAQGTTEQTTFTLTNTGSSPININISHDLDLIDNDGDETTLTFSDPGTIQPNQAVVVTITADADTNADFETYDGVVTVRDANSPDMDTVALTVIIAPDVCDSGEVGDDLILEIEDPDDNEEFEPGDTITIKANVQNVGDDDIRTQIEAFLFTDKGQIGNAASETANIENGDEDDFTLSLKIPLDSRKIDEDDDFTLFVKAFDDDQEQLNCVQQRKSIQIKLTAHKIVIDPAGTKFLPSMASCGDTVVANVHVVNIGKKDNDHVTLMLSNKELGIQKQSDTFTIEAFSAEEDNDEVRQFTVNIPEDASNKKYFFSLTANYEGGTASEQLPLEIISCQSTESLIRQGEVLAVVAPVESSFSAKQSSIISVPVKVKNNVPTKQTFIIDLTNVGDFGVSAPKTVLLNSLQETTVFLDLQVNDNAEPGIHTGVIEVRLEGMTVASETVAIEVQEREGQQDLSFTSVYAAIPIGVWIVLIIIVIGVLIITIRILLNNRKD